jgi:rubrerythrin
MRITTTELRSLASDVDDMHRDTMRTFREEAAELHLAAARGSRRGFLRKAGMAGVGGTLLATGGPLLPLSRILPAGAQELTDTVIAGYAQSIELAAVAAYQAAAGALPDEVRPVGELFASHHQEHADAFGAVAGSDARPEANPTLVQAVTPTLEAVGRGEVELPDILRFARDIENQAVYTYAFALTALQNPAFAAATSTILPVEAQHATVLTLAAGGGVPELFPQGAFEVTAVGDGTDPNAGLDPAVFG